MIALLLLLQVDLPVKLAGKHYDLRAGATKEQAQELLDFMELAHAAYSDLLRVSDSAEAKRLVLHLHKDRDEYLKAGGPQGSGAFYDGKKLVGYWDPAQMKGFFAHEGVHQLVHLGSKFFSAFPEWFHEGFADALGSFEVKDGKLRVCALNGSIAKMRLPYLQQAMRDGQVWKLSEFLSFGPKRFKEGSPLTYAVAWSFCHFLMAYPSDEDPTRPAPDGKYRAKFLNYYRLLAAGGTTSDKAWAKAFKDVPTDALEKEWREYVARLRDFPVRLSSRRYEMKSTSRQAREILDFMELVHEAYADFFPKAKPPRATLLLYRDKDEYLASGAPKETEAHYNGRELAGYWDETIAKACFAHEGMHQFLGPGTWPPWFAEGLGECFANFEMKDGKVVPGGRGVIRQARLPALLEALEQDRARRLSDLVELDREKFWADPKLHYAQAWSFCQFLLASHRSKLQEYGERVRAGADHRKAWTAAFPNHLPDVFERDWREHVRGLK